MTLSAVVIIISHKTKEIVVFALYAFHVHPIDELWIEFVTGQHNRWYPIHDYAAALGEQKCHALPFWYAFTGCDTVSQITGRAKKTAWNTWLTYPDVTETFVRSSVLQELDDEYFAHLQRFVILMYDRTSGLEDVNTCRKDCLLNEVGLSKNVHQQRMPYINILNVHSY